MRHDFEKAVTETVALYVQASQSGTDLDGVQVASFYDAMAADDADRIIIITESGETKVGNPGNATVILEVGVKTQTAQPTLATDISTHFDRVNALRDLFNVANPATSIAAYNVDGIAVTHVEPVRRFETTPDRDSGFIYSTYELVVHCHTTEE